MSNSTMIAPSATADMIGRVIYRSLSDTDSGTACPYLYVIAVQDGTAYGVGLDTSRESATGWVATGFESYVLPVGEGTEVRCWPITGAEQWPATVARFLSFPTAPEGITEEEAERRVREARADVERSMTVRFEEWKERATRIAHEYADNNSLCSEFDRCMEDVGLEPRTRDFTVTLDVSLTVTVPVSGMRDGDAAADYARGVWRDYVDSDDYADVSVADVEED